MATQDYSVLIAAIFFIVSISKTEATVCTLPVGSNNIASLVSSSEAPVANQINVTATATLQCAVNHRFDTGTNLATDTFTCSASETWTPTPNCVPVCAVPPTLGSDVATPPTYTNTLGTGHVQAPTGTASIECTSGHIWTDNTNATVVMTCTAAGTWDITSPNCKIVCSKPPTLGALTAPAASIVYVGSVGASYVTAGMGTATIACVDANHIWSDGSTGTKVLSCTAAGTWTACLDCEPVCATPPTFGANVDASSVVYANTLGVGYVTAPTGTATVSCDANHVWADGTASTKAITCTTAGTWSVSPVCKPACPKPPTVPGGSNINPAATGYTNELGTAYVEAPSGTALYQCNTGYLWSDGTAGYTDKAVTTCATQPTWSAITDSCVAGCEKPPPFGTAVDTGGATYTNDVAANSSWSQTVSGTATVQCQTNHIWEDGNTGSKTYTCSAAAAWTPPDADTDCAGYCAKPSIVYGNNVNGAMTTWVNMPFSTEVTTSSGKAVVVCSPTYAWIGAPKDGSRDLFCLAGPTWQICEPCYATCSQPSNFGINQQTPVYSETISTNRSPINSTVTITCNANHVWASTTGTATKVLTCTPDSGFGSGAAATASWQTALTGADYCQPTCHQPSIPLGQNVATGPTFSATTLTDRSPVGATATVSCQTNFVWNGDEASCAVSCPTKTMTCTATSASTAAWSVSPTCNPTCVQPVTPLGTNVGSGTITYSNTVLSTRSIVSSTATLLCDPLHVWVGAHAAANQVVTCQSDGTNSAATWSTHPDCEKTCVRPPVIAVPSNVQLVPLLYSMAPVLTTRSPINDNATLSCLTNHVWTVGQTDSTKEITCQADGTWTAYDTCETTCDHSPTTGLNVNPVVSFTSTVWTTRSIQGSTAMFTCQPTFLWVGNHLSPNETIACTATGWQTPSPDCEPSCAQPPAYGQNNNATATTYLNTAFSRSVALSTATVFCTENYYFVTDNAAVSKTINCQADGTWDSTYDCIGTCAPFVPTTGQTIVYNDTVLAVGPAAGRYKGTALASVTCNNALEWYIFDWINPPVAYCNDQVADWEPSVAPRCVRACDVFTTPFDEFGDYVLTSAIQYSIMHLGKVRETGKAKARCRNGAIMKWEHDVDAYWFEMTCNSSGLWDPPETPNCLLDDCHSSPCVNNGECIDIGDSYECNCPPAFGGIDCEIPLTSCGIILTKAEQRERRAMMASQTLSGVILMSMLGFLLIVFALLLDSSLTRVYHAVEEASLLFAHAVVLPARTPTLMDAGAFCDPLGNPDYDPFEFGDTFCRVIALFLHYIYLVHFGALAMESVHNFTCYTYTHVKMPVLSKKRFLQIAFTWPLPVLAITSSLFWTDYNTINTCWMNVKSPNMYFALMPICVLVSIAVVANEATTMEKYPTNPVAKNKMERWLAFVNSRGGMLIPLLSFVAWILGVHAVHLQDISLYSIVLVFNIALGCSILVFHTVGNQRARKIVIKVCCCCCAERFRDENDPEEEQSKDEQKDVESNTSKTNDASSKESDKDPKVRVFAARRDRMAIGTNQDELLDDDFNVEDLEPAPLDPNPPIEFFSDSEPEPEIDVEAEQSSDGSSSAEDESLFPSESEEQGEQTQVAEDLSTNDVEPEPTSTPVPETETEVLPETESTEEPEPILNQGAEPVTEADPSADLTSDPIPSSEPVEPEQQPTPSSEPETKDESDKEAQTDSTESETDSEETDDSSEEDEETSSSGKDEESSSSGETASD